MATAAQNVVSHVKENKQTYLHPNNIITLVMWGLALGSHAILIPLFIREVVLDFKTHRSTGIFG